MKKFFVLLLLVFSLHCATYGQAEEIRVEIQSLRKKINVTNLKAAPMPVSCMLRFGRLKIRPGERMSATECAKMQSLLNFVQKKLLIEIQKMKREIERQNKPRIDTVLKQ